MNQTKLTWDDLALHARVLAEERDLYRTERDALRRAAEVAEQHAAYGRCEEAARVLQDALRPS